jgi:non-specific serine/threonine protein kinase/serine/threonine-protein kinase
MNQDKELSATAATELDALPVQNSESTTLAPGTRLGVYRIRRALGEGGMGQVYLAEQTAPVRRDVALKLIREQIASPLALAWFEVERQALAQMQHPAIAQIFDAGTTPEGHAYIAMEYVEGTPLDAYCRTRALSREQRITLFVRICQGVQHAHQKGVIHRDLKPANVLVRDIDATPMPKIIDFGIAVGGDGNPAGQGAVVSAPHSDRAGTAIYMSPEQASGGMRDIDTRSDVYALGVMLCELMTDISASVLGMRAHGSAAALHGTLLTVLASDRAMVDAPSSSRALLDAARRLPKELRAILRKALAIDRADRYDSAAALADDLERFLEQRPVKALPPTRTYLTRCFVARHRFGLFALGLVLAALIVGAALAVHGLTRARASAELARAEAAKSARVAGFVRNMLAGIDPDRARGMDSTLMRTILDSAAERIGRELGGQPDVRAEIERTIAESYASLGDYRLAQTHFDAAIEASQAAGSPVGVIARAQARSAYNLDNQGRQADALSVAEKAFAGVRALSRDDRDRLGVETTLASIEADNGKPDVARASLQKVLALQRRLFGDDSEDVLATISALAAIDLDTNHLDEAQPLFEELLERRIERYGDEHSKTLAATNGLAIVALEQKRFADAEKLLAPQLPTIERVFGPDHPLTLRLISNLGGAIRQQDRNEDARPYYERAAALSRTLYGEQNPNTIIADSNLSLLLRDSGNLTAAEARGRIAVRNADIVWPNNAYRAIMHRELATVLVLEHRYAEAAAELDLAWDVFSKGQGFGPRHPRSQDVVDTALDLYKAWGKPDLEAVWRARKTASANNAADG